MNHAYLSKLYEFRDFPSLPGKTVGDQNLQPGKRDPNGIITIVAPKAIISVKLPSVILPVASFL
ncbi:MAG: hypothetical protein CM1200mP30_11800 [Pseudomonadota bacterium]|nr:MAG: hypothetical protein CM1200mP30_11800 [Pseudomonadota bacterium]